MTQVPLRRNRDFVLLQTGQVLSSIGSESTSIAYPLLVLATTGSPAKAGIVGFARIVPWALCGFAAGVVVDRVHRTRLMIVSDVVRTAAVVSIVLALALDELTFAQVAVVAFVEGAMYVFFNVAEIGALRSVVPSAQLPAAAAAEQARYSTVALVSAPLGGSLFGIGRTLPFAADAVSYAFSLASLLAIRTPFQEARETSTTRMREELAEGFRWLWGHSFFRTCAILFTGSNLVFEATALTLVVIGRRQGLSGAQIGLLVAALGACSLLGSVLAPGVQRRLSMRAIVLGSFWVQLAIAGFLFHPSVFVLLACAIPISLTFPSVNAVVIGYRVAIVPDRLTGRVNSVARTIALCGAPLGPLAAGLMLGSLSARATVTVLVCFLLGLALVATSNRAIRNAPKLSDLDDLPTPA